MTKPVVLITGALTGIGRATALAFGAAQANIVVSGRHQDKGDALVAELAALGAEAEFVRADIRHEDDVKALVDRTVARFGRLDIAVNNAGKEGLSPITEVTADHYADVFDTNVLGMLWSLKHEFRAMKAAGKGSIVNIGSVFGHVGFGGGGAVYAASKFAVEGLTKSTALEGAPLGIRVNAVTPGPIETAMFNRVVQHDDAVKAQFIGMIPAKRAGTVEEVAALIAFLAGDTAPYITGEIVSIDGGFGAG